MRRIVAVCLVAALAGCHRQSASRAEAHPPGVETKAVAAEVPVTDEAKMLSVSDGLRDRMQSQPIRMYASAPKH